MPRTINDDDYWLGGDYSREHIEDIETLSPFVTTAQLQNQEFLKPFKKDESKHSQHPHRSSGEIDQSVEQSAEDEGEESSDYDDPDFKFFGMRAGSAKQRCCVICCLTSGCCCCFWIAIFIFCLVAANVFVTADRSQEQPLSVACPPTLQFCNWRDGINTPPNNITRYLRWPGCQHIDGPKPNHIILQCGPPCYDDRYVEAMDDYNRAHEWKKVKFPSAPSGNGVQQDLTELTGWWLPTDQMYNNHSVGGRAPVIIIQHGVNHNFNSHYVQIYAYILRSIGFNVFLPNLRDHGDSQHSTHHGTITWGHEYYLDLLGAWQFVVDDPGGNFGGPRNASDVGVAGFESGALIAATVLGLNQSIPGAWLDSGLYDVENGALRDALTRYGYFSFFGWFFRWLTPLTYHFARSFAGVDIGYKTPINSIPCESSSGQSKQKISLLYNSEDSYEARSEAEELRQLFGESPLCYDLAVWEATSECHGNRCTMLFQSPEVYRKQSCTFWSGVFQRPEAVCDAGPAFPVLSPVKKRAEMEGSSSSVSSSGSKSSVGTSKFSDESSLTRSSSSSAGNTFRFSSSSITSWSSSSSSSNR